MAQHTILALNLAASAAVLGLVTSGRVRDVEILLLLPYFSAAFGYLYLDHGWNIQEIAEHVRTKIEVVFEGLGLGTPVDPPPHDERAELFEKGKVFAPTIALIFAAPPTIAISWVVSEGDVRGWVWSALVGAIGATLAFWLLYLRHPIFRHVDVPAPAPDARRGSGEPSAGSD